MTFPQNVVNATFEQRNGQGKLINGHGKVMEKHIAKYVRALIYESNLYDMTVE